MRTFLLCLALVFSSACSTETEYTLEKNFSLVDASSKMFSLSDYKGKAVVVIFWATWCPYCAKVMPSLEKYYQQYQSQGLEIIAVNIMEDADPIAHMKRENFSYRLGLEGDKVAKDWQVSGTPTLFFINRSGKILAKNQISDPDSPVIKKLIEQILE